MSATVQVCAPCRLHFGMFSFGHADRPQFGGVGAMVAPPNVKVTISASDFFAVDGHHAARVKEFAELAAKLWGLPSLPACRIEVRSPADHTGLGVGTQLGLAVAAGLRRFLGLPEMSIESLASSVGRGKRSAVGTFGFQQGGLIVDAGKGSSEEIGKLARRVALPAAWRFVLVLPKQTQGLAGEHEAEAFAQLPPVPVDVTRELLLLANEQMLPAVVERDCTAFGEAVYRFGRLAGECFSAAQGGPFASPQIADWVESIRKFGIAGVGQSSWGPTVFAVVANEAEADRLAHWLRSRDAKNQCEVTIAQPNNSGVVINT